jgi:hypothetical protein
MSSSAVGRSTRVGQPARVKKPAEDAFVDDMMRISQRVLAKMSPAEREERLRKFNDYLAGLDGSAPKRS